MNELLLTCFCLSVIFLINIIRDKIAQKTNLFDLPDNTRKFHKKNTPLLGGIMIFSTLFLSILNMFLFDEYTKIYLIIFVASSFFFFIGLMDDILNIAYRNKLILLTIISSIFVTLEPNLQITKIYFSTLNKIIYLNHFSILFTVICILLLTNAINLIDGINGLCILISIIIFSWILLTFENINFVFTVFISLFFILVLNMRGNIFLGDSGSLLLGSLISFLIISNYNYKLFLTNFAVEDIFIILMLPGIDMLRVFVIRILNKKNPFISDRNHLHYLLLDNGFNLYQTLTTIIALCIIPIIINSFTNILSLFIILLFITIYTIIIFNIKKNK
jgi:UDP-GlcNAc:undecaprenyl-phosphate GlcNAc-1-phosphate transferase